jgi:hypothetical protein
MAMNPLFAMANLTEAESKFLIPAGWGGLWIVGVLLFFAWLRQSWRLALVAGVITMGVGVVLRPWHALVPTPWHWQQDPEYVQWLVGFRIVSMAWVVALLISVRLVFCYTRRKRRGTSDA